MDMKFIHSLASSSVYPKKYSDYSEVLHNNANDDNTSNIFWGFSMYQTLC